MRGTIDAVRADGRTLTVYRPPEGSRETGGAVVLAGEEFSAAVPAAAERLEPSFGRETMPFWLVSVEPLSWEDDFTPWPAENGGRRFGGRADAFFRWLLEEALPSLERTHGLSAPPERTGIAGYSLGGLAALWGWCRFPRFGRAASASGSLWYPGWSDFFGANLPEKSGPVFLSLGLREEKTRDPLMAQVGDATRAAAALLRERLGEDGCELVFNPGGHFNDPNGRLVSALARMMRRAR